MTPAPWGRRHPREFWSGYFRFLLALIAAAIIITLLAAAMPARGHDFWINNYRNADGTNCCGRNDCEIYPIVQTKMLPDGSVELYLLDGGLFETVPASEVQISEDREAWRCKRYDGSRRCFFYPGGMS